MGYRLPEDRQHYLSVVADQSLITVDNGTISRISIPCFYKCPEENPHGTKEHRILHDHFGWPSPEHPDDSCQLPATKEYAQVIAVNEIDLVGEGYTDVEVCMTGRPDGLSVQTMLDENVIRLTIYAQCPAANTKNIDVPFSIYATGSFSENDKTETMLRDVVTKGILRVIAGPITLQDQSDEDDDGSGGKKYEERLADCEQDISDLKVDVDGIKDVMTDYYGPTFTEHRNRIESCENGLDAIDNLIDGLQNADVAIGNRIDGVNTEITTIENTMTTTLSNHTERIESCENDLSSIGDALQGLRNADTAFDTRITACENAIAGGGGGGGGTDYGPRITNLESRTTTCENDIDAAESDIDQCQQDINSHDARITACENAIAGGGGGGGGIDYGPRISSLESRTTTCENDIDAAENDIDQCQQDITNHNTRIIACENDIDAAESDIDQCQQDINSHGTRITACENDIDQCQHDITSHDARITACENAISGGGGGGGSSVVSKTGKIYYVNNNITLDKTGATDVTTAITNFINTVPEGSTLIFEKGTYKVSTLAITKSLDVDFSGSTIVSSGNYGITFSGTLKRETTLSQKFEPYQSHVKLANSTGVAVGDLLVIYSEETLNPNRAYYRKAFTCIVSSLTDTDYGISIDVKCPFDVPSGASVKVYKPVSGSLRNIEKFQHSMDPYHNIVRSVQLNQACDFLIENVNCRQNIDYHIFVSESNHVIIQRCSIYVDRIDDDQNNHMYFVCIGGCSHTVTRDCHGVSNWHMWTTGGTTTTSLFSLVEGCTHVSMKAGSFVDHPAAIYTTIRDCQGTSAISISAGGTIENTVITEYKISDNDYYKPRFTCQAWGADYDFLNYNISNCKIVVNGDTVGTNQNGAAINIVGVNGSGGTSTAWYARSISIDGVSSNRPVYMTTTPGISVKQVSLSNCHNIMPACAENTGDIVNLQMSNCVISGVPTLATFGHIYNNTVTTILMGLGTNTTINNLQLSDIPSGYAYCFVANSRERKLLINNLMDTTTQPLVITSTHNYLMVHLANCVGYLNAGGVLIDQSLGADFPHLRIIGSVVYVIGNVSHDDAASTIITSLPS